MILECWQIKAYYHGSSHGDASRYIRGSKILGPVFSWNSCPILSHPCPALLWSAGGAGFSMLTRAYPDSSLRTPHYVALVPLGWSHLLVCFSLKKAVLPRSFPFPKFPVFFFFLHIQYPKPMPKITRMSLFVLPVIKDSFQDLLWVIQACHQLSLKLL